MPGIKSIRHISTTFDGDRFAVAEFEKIVQIWHILDGYLCSLKTNLDFGGQRLSISEDGKYLTVGCYNPSSITLFEIETKNEIWKRKDLKRCQVVQMLSLQNNAIFVRLQNQATQLLNSLNGETIKKLSGGSYYKENHFGTIDLIEKLTQFALLDRMKGKYLKSFSKLTFAILDACFSEHKALVAYSGNSMEAVNLHTLESVI